MIVLTRLNGKELVVNLEQILFVEATPDTCLTMIGGDRLMVREPVFEVVRRAEAYRRRARWPEPVAVENGAREASGAVAQVAAAQVAMAQAAVAQVVGDARSAEEEQSWTSQP